MSADFTPILNPVNQTHPFRYWCQKVLPLVYDDSLSYYELLCKVVDYLNHTMEDVNLLSEDVTNLHNAYKQLEDYVNNYFESSDFTELVNNKLDEMATDGTLTEIMEPFFSGLQNLVNNQNLEIDEIQDELGRFQNRVNNQLTEQNTLIDNYYSSLRSMVTGVKAVSLVSQMTDTDKIYVYTGSETGYASGNWYYYNGNSWVSGGIFQSGGVSTDPTLTLQGVPADAAATGAAIDGVDAKFNALATYNTLYYNNALVVNTPVGTWQHLALPEIPVSANVSAITSKFDGAIADSGTLPTNLVGITYRKNGADVNTVYLQPSRKTITTTFEAGAVDGVVLKIYTNNATAVNSSVTVYNLTVTTNGDALVALKDISFNGKKLSEYIEQGLIYKGNVTTNSLLDYLEAGFYTITSQVGNGLVDNPSNASDKTATMLVIHPSYNSATFATQIYIDIDSRVYTRIVSITAPSVVKDWVNIANPDPKFGLYYAFGDSWTSGVTGEGGVASTPYPRTVGKLLGMETVLRGQGGTGWMSTSGGVNAKEQVDYMTYSNAKLFTFAYGLNDYLFNWTLGSYTDTPETESVCGRMKYCINKVLTDSPEAYVVVILPPMITEYGTFPNYALDHVINGKTLQQFIDEMKKVCNLMHVKYIEMTALGLPNSYNAENILTDGIHPEESYYDVVARVIAKAIDYFGA